MESGDSTAYKTSIGFSLDFLGAKIKIRNMTPHALLDLTWPRLSSLTSSATP